MVVFPIVYTRREVLTRLVFGGLVASLAATQTNGTRLLAEEPSANLLTNGSFEQNGFGRTMTGWTIVDFTVQADS